MESNFNIWQLLAGLGIFLFGMYLLEESVKKLSGKAFKTIVRDFTNTKFKSIVTGTSVTALLQSSTAVSLMVLAFTGAGIMTMQNAIGVILGSNLGTTVTAWIVATVGFQLNIEEFTLPLIGIGGLGLIFLGQSEKYANISKLIVGFGFLFMGLNDMKSSVELYAIGFDPSVLANKPLILFLITGILLTGIMQSSSASIAITLTALNAGVITFTGAASLVIGANIGTTITILLGTIGGTQAKKRVAYSHLGFNFITGIFAFALIKPIVLLIEKFINLNTEAVVGLAVFHTLFNVLGIVIFLPFINLFAKLLLKLFPDRQKKFSVYLQNTITEVPEAGIEALHLETKNLISQIMRFHLQVLNIDETLVFEKKHNNRFKKVTIDDFFGNLKDLQSEIISFSIKISSQPMAESDSEKLNRLMHASRLLMHSAKQINDIKTDFEELENSDNQYINNLYSQFRKRLIDHLLSYQKLLESETSNLKGNIIFKLLKKINDEDKSFITLASKQIANGNIKHENITTIFVVNRAFVQASRQLILGIKDVILPTLELKHFEAFEDLNEIVGELN